MILRGVRLRGAGIHGGGIVAFLTIGLIAVSTVLGAIAGGVFGGIPALIVVLLKRRRRQAETTFRSAPAKFQRAVTADVSNSREFRERVADPAVR